MSRRPPQPPPDEGDRLVDHQAQYDTSKEIKAVVTFDSILKNPEVLRGAYNYGFEKPSAIQQRAILPILQGRDLIAQAQSGTGKTSMISLVVCEKVDIRLNE